MSEDESEKKEEIANTLRRLDSVMRHIEHVRENCELLGRRYIEKGEIDFGIQLIRRGLIHDNSKLVGLEFKWLTQDDNKPLLKEAIESHQRTNDHHVEAWGLIEDMPPIALAELVCDLRARSTEFGTDLREYFAEDFMPKYKVAKGSRVYKHLKEALDLLLEKPFKKL